MSPASKSKSKDKATRATKEQPKVLSKSSSAPVNGGNGAPASAYNPVSGTFHTLETTPSASLPGAQSNGRFRTIDETEEHSGSSQGTTGEFDSASNNGSCSGESEDQKEKTSSGTPRIEPIPGCDTDKRDKIRQKNERKHQRQKERRAQELHERCSGYLMSRKLETLAQQLVQMGFSSESATMALIQNEGRVEESVAWLFEGGEESKQQVAASLEGGVNLKIDITDELAKIAEMEVRFKCTKQEVERAVVACEGDLEKAEETLKAQKQEPVAAPPKLEESGDPAAVSTSSNKMAISAQNPAVRTQVKVIASVGTQQQRRDERDFNYGKSATTGVVSQESGNRNLQSLRRVQPKPDWGRPQVSAPLEKRWLSTSSAPSVSYSLPLQAAVPQTKPEARYMMAGNEVKANLQAGTLREPVIVMQRPQSKQSLPPTSLAISVSPPASTGWYSNGMPSMEMKVASGGLGHNLPTLGLNGSTPQQFVPQSHFQTFVSSPMESGATGWGGSWSSTGTSSSLAVPSSLGLFTGWGSSGSSASSPVDWSTGGSTPRDYTSIDWSLDRALLRPSSSVKSDRLSDSWSPMFMGGKVARPVVNGGGVYIAGLQDGSLASDPPSAGSHEWTSPFAGKDLFRVPRQYVTSPSL